MANSYGLTESDMAQLIKAFYQFEEVATVVLFGSRAKGNYKPGSDVDLAVKGDRITHRTITQLADLLNEELPLPYFLTLFTTKPWRASRWLTISIASERSFTTELAS